MKSLGMIESMLNEINTFKPSNIEFYNYIDWDSKLHSLKAIKTDLNFLTLSKDFFNGSSIEGNINSHLLLISFGEDALIQFLNKNRVNYYSTKITIECNSLLYSLSNDIIGDRSESVKKVIFRLRWLIFKTHAMANDYNEPFDNATFLENIKDDSTLHALSNLFILIDMRNKLFDTLCIIISVSDTIIINFKEDSLGKLILDDRRIHNFFCKYYLRYLNKITSKHMDVSYITSIYSILKSKYSSFFKDHTNVMNDDDHVLLDSIKISENLLFYFKVLQNFIDTESPTIIDISSENILFDLANNIQEKLEGILVPDKRLFEIDSIISKIKMELNDQVEIYDNYLLPSVPRVYLRKLQFQFDTLKANPTIDLEKLNRANLEPIITILNKDQLAYFFKSLKVEGIITVKNNQQLFKTISSVFQTKGNNNNAGSSFSSFGNKYYKPTKNAIIAWITWYSSLSQAAMKDDKNYLD